MWGIIIYRLRSFMNELAVQHSNRSIHPVIVLRFNAPTANMDNKYTENYANDFKWLNRRSQKQSFNWEKFGKFLKRYPVVNPKVKVNIYDLGVAARYIM